MHRSRFFPAVAAALAASLCALADDPPPEDAEAQEAAQRESEKRYDEFCREWRRITAHMEEGLTRTFTFEAKGGEVPVTGTVVIEANVPDPESVVLTKKVTLDNAEELKGKRVELPPLIAAGVWAEPPPMPFPEKGSSTIEKDVEVKVGEKTLKCWKLTVTTGPDAPISSLNLSYWICPEGYIGLVRATLSSATGKSMTMQMIDWKAGSK